MRPTLRATDARAVHAWDGFVLFWIALWMVLGVWTGVTLWHTADTGDTISTSGRTLTSIGKGLQGLSDIPVIGNRPAEIGNEVVTSAADITDRGQLIKGQLRRLAVLLGVATVAIPIMPVAGFYLPLRLAWRRQVKDVQDAIAADPDDPELDRHLAAQARATMSYAAVRDLVRAHPAPDEQPGTTRAADRALADAQLARMGLQRT